MEINLKGRHALVGGSSKGIGRAIALQLARSGARVTVAARNSSALQAIVAEMEAHNPAGHHHLCVDYSDFKNYKSAIAAYLNHSPADIVVNNTQGPPAGTSLEQTSESYQSAFELLFQTAVATTTAALPHMQRQQWGRIINVASVSVREPLGYLALSNTMRAAVVSWGKTLASDTGRYGITVNSVLTGYFDTERLAALNDKKAQQMGIAPEAVTARLKEQVPLGRLGRPEEYGFLAAFLASDQAAYLTGAVIPLDGGLLRSY